MLSGFHDVRKNSLFVIISPQKTRIQTSSSSFSLSGEDGGISEMGLHQDHHRHYSGRHSRLLRHAPSRNQLQGSAIFSCFFFSCFLGIQTRLYVMVLFFFFYFLGFSRAQEKMNERLKEFESKMKKTEKLEEFENSS